MPKKIIVSSRSAINPATKFGTMRYILAWMLTVTQCETIGPATLTKFAIIVAHDVRCVQNLPVRRLCPPRNPAIAANESYHHRHATISGDHLCPIARTRRRRQCSPLCAESGCFRRRLLGEENICFGEEVCLPPATSINDDRIHPLRH